MDRFVICFCLLLLVIGCASSEKADPDSHITIFENEKIRVLKVIVPAGTKEPFHTHGWESMMFVHQGARMNYYGADKTLIHRAPDKISPADPQIGVWMEAEGLHALENIVTVDFVAIRVELKSEGL